VGKEKEGIVDTLKKFRDALNIDIPEVVPASISNVNKPSQG
jgi:hypothetical protein